MKKLKKMVIDSIPELSKKYESQIKVNTKRKRGNRKKEETSDE